MTFADAVAPRRLSAVKEVGVLANHLASNTGISPRVEVWLGNPPFELTRMAADLQADFLVLGRRGRSAVSSMLLGSVSDRVALLSTVPVVIVH